MILGNANMCGDDFYRASRMDLGSIRRNAERCPKRDYHDEPSWKLATSYFPGEGYIMLYNRQYIILYIIYIYTSYSVLFTSVT